MPAAFDVQRVGLGIDDPQFAQFPADRLADVLEQSWRRVGKTRGLRKSSRDGELRSQTPVRVLAGRNVTDDTRVNMFVVLVVLTERKFDLNLLAGFMNSVYFDNGAFPAPRLGDVLFIIWNNAVDELADHLRNAVAKNALCSSTDRQYLAFFINRDDGVCRCFLDDFVSVFKLFHCLLSVWTVLSLFGSNVFSEQRIYQTKPGPMRKPIY